MLTKPQVFNDDTHKQALGYQNLFYLKKTQRIKPTLYDGSVISNQHVASHVTDDEETLILKEVNRSKMLAKQNDPMSKEKKVNTTLINYVELNRLSEDFGKRFVPQQELSAEQAFWLQTSHPNTDQSALSPVKIEAPKELPKIKLDAIIEEEWGFEHTVNDVNLEMQRSKFCVKCLDLDAELLNKQNAYNDLLKSYSQFEKHCISLELTMQLNQEIFQKDSLNQFDSIKKTRALSKEHCDSLIAQLNLKSMENADLKGQIQEKDQEDILQGIVEQAKAKQPLNNALNFACKHAKRIQELLVYVRDTCPNAYKPSKKLVAVTPMNKVKKVRFSEPLTSSSNIHKQAESSKTPDSNTPMLPSTGLKSSTNASRSQPTGNKKNDRISQTPSSNMKNKNLEGVDLLSGSRDTNLYTISLDDMLKTSPICLLSKASKTKSWLWHRRLSHLNFSTLNKLAKDGLARGIPKLKYNKDHLCSACALGKSKKSSHQPKAKDTNQEKLYLLHMDLCGPMRVESINGKRYILVIVDDYSQFTWVAKDEAPDAIIKCIKNIQVRLNTTVHNVRTDNGSEFVNQTLREFYENISIMHQTSVARTPQQNSIVERQNRILVEAARTMLIFTKALLFM
ncbi:retrovirus-related pol polyprotein from transposon TNT 1-94 [Tanacetum coccineum]